ncbi:MAG: CHRD domain-containing protein [Pseudomonadales bacterium]|nr:CHRD domain-containing protein [Pseudomonadales bacterium]
MPKHLVSLAAVFLLVGTANICQAGLIPWTASINETQEVPASGSTATGFATGTLDDISGLLSWDISFTGLTGPATAMHFHGPATVGVNAGVQVNIGAISGLFSPSIGSTLIDVAQAAQLLAGNWYINIHTAIYPGGEIRGQVVPGRIPIPATLTLFGIGLAGLGWSRRKRA